MGSEKKPPRSAGELLARYAAGEREFARALLPNARLAGAQLPRINLDHANLGGADLGNANLQDAGLLGADLSGVNLTGANLTRANLARADLLYTDFTRANLRGASFRSADLVGAVLDHAVVVGADLGGARFHQVTMVGADLGGSRLTQAHFIETDLLALCEATPPVEHRGPSHVDYLTVVRSTASSKLTEFLQRTGMPASMVLAMITTARQLQNEAPGMLQSTFISYGGPDTAFAQQLNDALLKNGVTTFFFAKDAVPGKKLHRLMREGVNQHDRVILICSRASLDRPGVLNEIAESLQREARDGAKEYLIPITLDDYVFSGWKPEDPGVAQAIKDRVVADFRGAETDPAKFNDGVLRLIAALKK